ncbi:MAG: nitroreductase family protein [Asgard group archaeon]|nr:nitroreductase family protein [Asgard group archaeon]
MDVIEAINSRRSIRKFQNKLIPEEIVTKLLRAAMQAPSAGNNQPWHFVVITDRNILNKIPDFHPYSKMLLEAPLAILICGEYTAERFCGYWVQDCSAATENLLLAAHALGLGAVWLGIYPIQERVDGLNELLNLPRNIYPLSLIAIGYPDEEKKPENRYKEDKIHYNTW